MSVSSLKLWRKNPRGMGWNLPPSALPPQLRWVKKNYSSYLGDCSFCISNFIVCDCFQKSWVVNIGRVEVRKLRCIRFFLVEKSLFLLIFTWIPWSRWNFGTQMISHRATPSATEELFSGRGGLYWRYLNNSRRKWFNLILDIILSYFMFFSILLSIFLVCVYIYTSLGT